MKGLLREWADKLYKYSLLRKENKINHQELLWKQKENKALQALINLLGSQHFLPHSDMALSPVAICHILNEILLNKRSNIIEFGAGSSTVYIACLIEREGLPIKFYSIDSDSSWISVMKHQLKKLNIGNCVELVHAPLKETNQFSSKLSLSYRWFDTNILKERIHDDKFDLVIVDGPMGVIGPYSRFPALPFLVNNLADSYAIFLDDIQREQERIILSEWEKLLSEQTVYRNNKYAVISKGLGFSCAPQ